MKDIDKETFEHIWDAMAPADFVPAELHPVTVGGHVFHKLCLTRGDTPSPVRIRLDKSMYGMPRFAAYRYRVVLFPKDVLLHGNRWDLHEADILTWLGWARRMQYMVTFSTYKSGASMPHSLHAQSFPLKNHQDIALTALSRAEGSSIIEPGTMPRFKSLRISVLHDYPLRGLCLTGEDEEVANKFFELALCYDNLKALNLVIVPGSNGGLSTFFFPRRRDGTAIYDMNCSRWQIAALEANGLLQAKTTKDLDKIDPTVVRDIFAKTGLSEAEFTEFCKLLQTF
jgi:hypothetical protein